MAARYRIVIADPLLGMGLVWPEGVSLIERQEAAQTGTHYWLVSDDGADPELEGREVSLAMGRDDDGQPVVRSRRAVVTHLAQEDGLACCGLAPWEMPAGDRLTGDPEAANCPGVLAEASP